MLYISFRFYLNLPDAHHEQACLEIVPFHYWLTLESKQELMYHSNESHSLNRRAYSCYGIHII